MLRSMSSVSNGSGGVGCVSEAGLACVSRSTAKFAAVSAASTVASVQRRAIAMIGKLGVSSGTPRSWPGRSQRYQWQTNSAGTTSKAGSGPTQATAGYSRRTE